MGTKESQGESLMDVFRDEYATGDSKMSQPIPGAFHDLATNSQMRAVCFHERAARAYEQLAKNPTVSKKERERCRENARQAREMADKVGA